MSDKTLNISFDNIDYDVIYLNSKKSIIGHGGNGNVYSLTINGNETNYVVKVLKKFDNPQKLDHRLKRFIKEIKCITGFSKEILIKNYILPIIYPVKDINDNINFYVMPKGKTFNTVDSNFDLRVIVNILSQILKALKFLHQNNLAHRDIKLANILKYNEQWFLSDFGLVISDKDLFDGRLTIDDEFVGPCGKPDELRYPLESTSIDVFKKSDVYLYGKLCWQLLTHSVNSFDGLMSPGSWAIKELKKVENKYECPILPLLEMMQKTICQLPEEREDLKFIENCLARQLHLIENSYNEEYKLCYVKQDMFFNLYSVKNDGYFKEDIKYIITLLESIKSIKISLYKNNTFFDYFAKFTILRMDNVLEHSIVVIKDSYSNNILFYLKPKRIESKDGCIQKLILKDLSGTETMNVRFHDEKFNESKLLTSNDFIQINCLSD